VAAFNTSCAANAPERACIGVNFPLQVWANWLITVSHVSLCGDVASVSLTTFRINEWKRSMSVRFCFVPLPLRDGSLLYFLTNKSSAVIEVITALLLTGSKLLSRSDGANKDSSSKNAVVLAASSESDGCRISLNDKNVVALGIFTLTKDLAPPPSNIINASADSSFSSSQRLTVKHEGDFTDVTWYFGNLTLPSWPSLWSPWNWITSP